MATGYTPIYRIFRGGVDYTDRFNDRTTSITVALSSGGEAGDTCDIVLDDRDWKIAYPEVGERIDVYLGYEEVGLAHMGSFEIDEVTLDGPPRSIGLHGNSIGMASAIVVPAIATHLSGTLGSVLTTLAEMAGLSASVHSDLAEKALPVLLQSVSPLHAISELAQRFGAIAKISEGTLAFVPRDRGVSVSGNVMPIFGLTPEHFGQWTVRYTQRTDYSSIRAGYWDADANTRKWIGQDRIGSFAPALEERIFRIERLFNSKPEAEAAALAQMQAMVRNGGTFYGSLAKGDPWIRDQQRISVRGMRDGIDGSYVIGRATHTYTTDVGISTSIEAASTGTEEDFEELFPEAGEGFLMPMPGEIFGELLKGPGGRVAGPV